DLTLATGPNGVTTTATAPTCGSLTPFPVGNPVTYTPGPGCVVGTDDTFTFTAFDGVNPSSPATERIHILRNTPPRAAFSYVPGEPVNGAPVGFTDASRDGDSLTGDPAGNIRSWSWV